MLIYSPLLGLREQHKHNPGRTMVPGTYMRIASGWVLCTYNKHIRHGKSFDWQPVQRDQLPPRLKAEALIMGMLL